MHKKRGQAGIEYITIMGFVTLAIIAILGLGYFYSNLIKDQIRLNQVENFATQIINSAESVYFAGSPSETTVSLYLPERVTKIEISFNNIIITTSTSSGENIKAFKSRVPLQGIISPGEGIKKLLIRAESDHISIS